ncbi:unnamed protein product [Heterobilharzia americana]|nr:unnamed protein product [Heterobilharzia americana]
MQRYELKRIHDIMLCISINEFGTRCKGCNQPIQPNESVLRLYTYKSLKSLSEHHDFGKKIIPSEQKSIATSLSAVGYEFNLLNEENESMKDSFNLSILIHYFHVYCFKCCDCNRLLTPGKSIPLEIVCHYV